MTRILIADDDREVRDLISYALKHEGFEVLESTTGHETLESVQKNKPDLIILDIMLPGIDGYTVQLQVAQNEKIKDIPVIVITAKAQNIDKVLALHIAKVDDYLSKPFSPKELIDSVESLFAKNEAANVTD